MSVDASIITVQKSRHSIRISQVAETGIFSHQHFEYLLRSIRYAHDPLRPSVEQYTASVSVSVHDGVFISVMAVTSIDVFIANTPPTVLLNGARNASAAMADGEATIPLLPFGATLFEDSTIIQQVLITLTNPSHSAEQIRFSELNVPASINVTSDESSIVLTGPATPADFSQALTDSGLYYVYPPMESILSGDRPEFTPR